MPLQNRVDPLGEIHAVTARGMFTGNRGVIHDPDSRRLLKRRWTTKAWIICDCGFQGRRRDVFGRNARSGGAGWTNLFFLDEVTAMAAGHRPCFECRREKAKEFADCFGKAFGVARPKVAEMDGRLHSERLASGGKALNLDSGGLAALPAGAMVLQGDRTYARDIGGFRRWSFDGYGKASRVSLPASLVTAPTMIAVLRAGYAPVWHPSATG